MGIKRRALRKFLKTYIHAEMMFRLERGTEWMVTSAEAWILLHEWHKKYIDEPGGLSAWIEQQVRDFADDQG